MASEGNWWNRDPEWAREHPLLWGAAYGVSMGLLWFVLKFALPLSGSTTAKSLLGAAVFGVGMGLAQLWAIKRRIRKDQRAFAAHAAEHWTARSSFQP